MPGVDAMPLVEGADGWFASRRYVSSRDTLHVEFLARRRTVLLVAQVIADRWGWPAAFVITAVGPVAMVIACLLMEVRKLEPKAGRLLNFRPVLSIARPLVTSLRTGRTASSYTESAPG